MNLSKVYVFLSIMLIGALIIACGGSGDPGPVAEEGVVPEEAGAGEATTAEETEVEEIEVEETTDSVEEEIDLTEINNALEEIAKSLALAMGNEAVRRFLHERVGMQETGDYEALYASIAWDELEDGGTLAGELASAYAYEFSLSSDEAEIKINEYLEIIPDLSITIPVNYDEWYSEEEIPVGYRPIGIDETELSDLPIFYADGTSDTLDPTEVPSDPIMFVGPSERTDGKGNILSEVLSSCDGAPSNDPLCYDEPSEPREYTDREKLSQLKVKHISSYEHWINGKPEIWLMVWGTEEDRGDRPGSLKYHGFFCTERFRDPDDDRTWENKWIKRNRDLYAWEQDEYGFYWYEHDLSLGLKDVEIDVGGVKIKFKITKFSTELGKVTLSITDKCADDPTYDTGFIEWYNIWEKQ